MTAASEGRRKTPLENAIEELAEIDRVGANTYYARERRRLQREFDSLHESAVPSFTVHAIVDEPQLEAGNRAARRAAAARARKRR